MYFLHMTFLEEAARSRDFVNKSSETLIDITVMSAMWRVVLSGTLIASGLAGQEIRVMFTSLPVLDSWLPW
jgi:hypothetical protein